MSVPAPLISNTTPQTASQTFVSATQSLTRATKIVGSVFADQAGTVYIDQSGDGSNFDVTVSYPVAPNIGVTIETDVISQYFRVRYINGGVTQTAFRLYVNILDPFGAFLAASLAPSAGGAYIVLYQDPSRGYQVAGRFDGSDGWNANGNAAVFTGKSGQYASFLVSSATVSQETIQQITNHAPASF